MLAKKPHLFLYSSKFPLKCDKISIKAKHITGNLAKYITFFFHLETY